MIINKYLFFIFYIVPLLAAMYLNIKDYINYKKQLTSQYLDPLSILFTILFTICPLLNTFAVIILISKRNNDNDYY